MTTKGTFSAPCFNLWVLILAGTKPHRLKSVLPEALPQQDAYAGYAHEASSFSAMATAVAAGTRKLSAAPHSQTPVSMPGSASGCPTTGRASPATLTLVGAGSSAAATFNPACLNCADTSFTAGAVLNSA